MSLGRIAAVGLLGLLVLGAAARLNRLTMPGRRLRQLYAAAAQPLHRWGLEPRTVTRRIGLRAGMRVLVVESGDGLTAQSIAREVGDTGFVETIAPSIAEAERVRLGCAGADVPRNVHVIASALDHVPFEDECFDAICCVAAFGSRADPLSVLAEAKRVLRPTGRLSASDAISRPAFRLRRSVERWGEAVGFEHLEHFGSVLAYTVNFRKPLGVLITG
jgi:ubiquinone/menaquinone biosynthesis C-methylase UbiE